MVEEKTNPAFIYLLINKYILLAALFALAVKTNPNIQTIDSLDDVEARGKEVSVISACVGQTRDASWALCHFHL